MMLLAPDSEKHINVVPISNPFESSEELREGPLPHRFRRKAWTLLLLVYAAVYVAALFSPPLLDDADSTHANAAKHIALSGDWVTLKVDGIRYLEKPPLPYWMVAIDYRVFGFNVFATHLPLAIGVLALAWMAWIWGRRAFGEKTAFYAALSILTAAGIFLFTRILIPEVLLAFLVALALYGFLTGLEDRKPARIYLAWAAIAVSMLAKGMVGPVFFLGAVIPYLVWTGEWRRWREFRMGTGILLFLAIAAPWHILAGLHNPDQGNPSGNHPTPGHVHGFFYFYFVNEQFLRFLGRRYPDDYNKLPAALYWSLHLVWLFPWSIYVPVAFRRLWRTRSSWWGDLKPGRFLVRSHAFRRKSILLLSLYAAWVLVFFSLSTNQGYYTFPAYFPLLLLTAAVLVEAEASAGKVLVWLNRTQAAFLALGLCITAALCYGLWLARKLPYAPDIGVLLDYRNVAGYTESMSHLFDLTGRSFAALRMPAAVAAIAFAVGPFLAWRLRRAGRHLESTVSVAFTAAIFLIAAHIALVRFGPMLSSHTMAETINQISGPAGDHGGPTADRATLILYGDQSYGSSILFYTRRPALLVNGRTTSMLWGSCYPDAPHIFLDDRGLMRIWGTGQRKFLFVPPEYAAHVAALLGNRGYVVQKLSGKVLYTDRPLEGGAQQAPDLASSQSKPILLGSLAEQGCAID